MRRFILLTLILALAFPPNAGALHFPDKTTGALDATMPIDNRIFTKAGRESIANDFFELGQNLETAVKGVGQGTVNLTVAVGTVIGALGELTLDNSKAGFFKTAEHRVATIQTANELMHHSPEWAMLLSNQPLDAEQRQNLELAIQGTAAKCGMSVDAFIFYLSESLKPVVSISDTGKRIYSTPGSTVQAVEDISGKYFRIEDTQFTGPRRYLDLNGNRHLNIKLESGKIRGISTGESQSLAHFNIGN